ncbi:hypothetical protein DL96DRAFT_1556852 [Flagelloscypha sp. PMI_526]|nr:hypothetical protein DL96DRAFT_1556852 [Flagelloscypha sp. PMI_526]
MTGISPRKHCTTSFGDKKAFFLAPDNPNYIQAPGIHLARNELFVFKSYIEALTLLKQKKQRFFRSRSEVKKLWRLTDVYGCLICGTPGIGKTTLLRLYLIISLALEHPILMANRGKLYFHTPHGLFFSREKLGSIAEAPVFYGLTLLVDLDGTYDTEVVYARNSVVHWRCPSSCHRIGVIHETCLCAHRIVLKDPKLQELFEFYGASSLSERNAVSTSMDIMGPNLRQLGGFNPHHGSCKGFRLKDLSKLFTIFQYNAPSVDFFSCGITICFPYTVEGVDPVFTQGSILYRIRSLSVMRLITQAYQSHHHKPLHEFYTSLHADRKLGNAQGWVFESLCHDVITNGTQLKIFPMKPRNMTLFLSSSQEHKTRSLTDYYVPVESNNPTFDGFFHGGDSANTLYAFQTTVGVKHIMKPDGLRTLVKRAHHQAPIELIFLIVPGSHFTVPKPPKKYESRFRFFTCEMGFSSSFEFPVHFGDNTNEDSEDGTEDEDYSENDWSNCEKVDDVRTGYSR